MGTFAELVELNILTWPLTEMGDIDRLYVVSINFIYFLL